MQVLGSATARKGNEARREKRREIQNEMCMRGREEKKGEGKFDCVWMWNDRRARIKPRLRGLPVT